MAKPEQGTKYTVVRGDTIRNIARAAYGWDRSDLILGANEYIVDRAKKDKDYISDEGLPIIKPNEILFIPVYKNRYDNKKITADFKNQVEIRIDGKKVEGAKASRIERAMNTIAYGFTFEVPFDYRNKEQADLFRPFTYKTAQMYIGGDLFITARCSKWDFPGNTAIIEARTMPGEMLECMGMRKTQVFASGLTLLKICQEVAKPYGITCYSANGTGGIVTELDKNASSTGSRAYEYDSNGKAVLAEATDPLPRIEQDLDQTDADFLSELAKQKGFLLTSLPDGNLLLCRANTADKPVVALRQGEYPLIDGSASFDGSKRFSKWMAFTEETDKPGINAYETDQYIPVTRGFVFGAKETKESNIRTAIKWRMSKSIAESCAVSVSVAGWRNAEGELWRENMKLTLYLPQAFIFKETQYITESVELTKDENGGDMANLQLVIPESYTTTMPKAPFPWDGYYSNRSDRVGAK